MSILLPSTQLLPPQVLIRLMDDKRYGVEYQPIIHLSSLETFAYECLARFFDEKNTQVRPDLVYASLHGCSLGLYQVEYQQKLLQLSNAPSSEKIFVNMDQDSYFASGVKGENNPFIELFKDFPQMDITIELIENSAINDAMMSLEMIFDLSGNEIPTALDDVCDPNSMISTSVIQLVEYIKLDRFVVTNRRDKDFLQLVSLIIDFAHNVGKKVVLEGIETTEDLDFARQLGVDFIQGFLFRDRFINFS